MKRHVWSLSFIAYARTHIRVTVGICDMRMTNDDGGVDELMIVITII